MEIMEVPAFEGEYSVNDEEVETPYVKRLVTTFKGEIPTPPVLEQTD